MLVAIYVDDLILAGTSIKELEQLKEALSSKYKMKVLGEPKMFLGMEIRRDRDRKLSYLSQRAYVKGLFAKYGMEDSKIATTPMNPEASGLSSKECPTTEAELRRVPYDRGC